MRQLQKFAISMFEMPIEDVFVGHNEIVVVTGCIASGEVRVGDTVEVHTPGRLFSAKVVALEVFGYITVALAGDNIGVRLKGIHGDDVWPGCRLTGK